MVDQDNNYDDCDKAEAYKLTSYKGTDSEITCHCPNATLLFSELVGPASVLCNSHTAMVS